MPIIIHFVTIIVAIILYFHFREELMLFMSNVCMGIAIFFIIWLLSAIYLINYSPKISAITSYDVLIINNQAIIVDKKVIHLNSKLNRNFKEGDKVIKTEYTGKYLGIFIKREVWNVIDSTKFIFPNK